MTTYDMNFILVKCRNNILKCLNLYMLDAVLKLFIVCDVYKYYLFLVGKLY